MNMKIDHPRRLLILSPPSLNISNLVKDLTGTPPTPNPSGALAGVTHEWIITTQYYTASVPIWLDQTDDIAQWATDFSSPEAKEVVRAIGAWVIVLDKAALLADLRSEDFATAEVARESQEVPGQYMQAVERVIDAACGYGWEGAKTVVGLSRSVGSAGQGKGSMALTSEQQADLDDRCMECGFEFMDASATGRNEFGERQGMERLREALEANDWSGSLGDDEDEGEFMGGGGIGGFDDEEEEMNAELWGLKAALHDPSTLGTLGSTGEDEGSAEFDEAGQVEGLEHLMSQAMAIKEAGADLPPEERKRHAARAINSLMKDM